ncbi:MAG: HEAT repeat domain-containing protein [bacterium]
MEQITSEYRKFIINRYKDIPCLDETVCLTMKNYIPLQLGEVKREEISIERRISESEKSISDCIDFRVWREEHSAQEKYSLTPVDVWRALATRKVVVKGDPGSGKTTLAHYIAYSLCAQTEGGLKQQKNIGSVPADLIPLVIDLKDWASRRTNGYVISLSEYFINSLNNSGFEEEEIKPMIDEWLKENKCILLCDGLDEVTEDRDLLIESLQNLASGKYRDCHIIVTTRIAAYQNELNGWKHYEIMPLKEDNIRQYSNDYLKDKSNSFLSALKNTPQIEPLSKNPLLLQILCFVFKNQKLALPAHRAEFYRQAVEEMLDLKEPRIPFSIKENVLQEIAIHLLEGKEIFEEDKLREIIKKFLESKKEDYKADDILKEIIEKSGLLCRLSDRRYISLHLTFQEYLSACYIIRKEKVPAEFLKPVLFNPRFREVIGLTAGLLPKEKAYELIQFILKQKPLCYDVLHQPLLLSGFCISRIKEDKIDSFEREIIDRLWKLWKETGFTFLRNEINKIFSGMAGQGKIVLITEKLLNTLKNKKENSDVRYWSTEALGNLGRADNKIIEALLDALKDKDEDLDVRGSSAEALGRLGRVDDRVIELLLDTLKDGAEHLDVRDSSAEALGRLGWADDRVIKILLNVLKNRSPFLDLLLVRALGNLVRADDRVIKALLDILKDKKEDSLVRSFSAEALSKLGRSDNGVIEVLLDVLKDKDEDSDVRSFSAEALSKLGRSDNGVIEVLLDVLKDKDEDFHARGSSAEALSELGWSDDRIIKELLDVLKHKKGNRRVRGSSAYALGNLGQVDERVIKALLDVLKDKKEYRDVRRFSTEALGNLDRADDRVIKALLNALKDEDLDVCWVSAEALGKLGRADNRVIEAFLDVLKDKDAGSDMRESSAEALGKLGQADDKVIGTLLNALKEKGSSDIYLALQRLVEKRARQTHITLSTEEKETGKKEDNINKDAERLLKFIQGFKKPPEEQSAGTHNDPQNQRIIGFLENEFTNTGKPLKILDYGCGKGSLITELKNLKQFKTGSHQYIGINYKTVEEVKKYAQKCGLHNHSFYTTEEFEKLNEPLNSDLIVIRNVTHEIPFSELGRRFYYVLKSLKTGGKLFLLDMCILPEGEAKSVTWEEEDFTDFFNHKSLKAEPNTYQSKSGLPLIAVTITKNSDNIPSEKSLSDKAVMLFEQKKDRTKKALELYKNGKAEITEFQYAHLLSQFEHIQSQLDEIKKN